jgi:hypothetical protein
MYSVRKANDGLKYAGITWPATEILVLPPNEGGTGLNTWLWNYIVFRSSIYINIAKHIYTTKVLVEPSIHISITDALIQGPTNR